jgi:hypothetical protein
MNENKDSIFAENLSDNRVQRLRVLVRLEEMVIAV